VTDDRFDDYVDEESISDFVPQDLGADGDLEASAGGDAEADAGRDVVADPEPDADADADANIDDAIDEPGTWGLPDATGVSSVDAAMAELGRLDELPTGEHVAVYEGLHRQLQDALADLDGS
jgi:hypothetical protein